MSKFILILAMSLSLVACKKAPKPEPVIEAPPVVEVIQVPEGAKHKPEANDPEGKLPVPPEALGPDGDFRDEPAATPVPGTPETPFRTICKHQGVMAECSCVVVTIIPTPTPAPSPTPTATPPVPLAPGTIVQLKSGAYEILGLASVVPSGRPAVTTYTTTIDGIQYRIKAAPKPVPEDDWQKDPNVFATSVLPLGVDKIVASGKLTAEQVESLRMENILKLFTYKNPDGLTPDYHKDMAYMLQRFIADGYLRGVNVIPILKAQSHKLVLQVRRIKEYSNEPLGLAVGETVSLSTRFWTSAPFYSRLRTFYHELGHAIFERGHICGMTLMHYPACSTSRPYPRGSSYDPLINEMFDPKKMGRSSTGGKLEGGARHNCPLSGC